jgi:hypothetical protein
MNVTVKIIFLSIKYCSFLFLEYHSRILRTYWATEHSVFLSESTFETFTSDTSILSSILRMSTQENTCFSFYLSLISKLFVNIDASDFDCYKMLYWSCDIFGAVLPSWLHKIFSLSKFWKDLRIYHCKAITTKNYENLGLIWCVHYHSLRAVVHYTS